MKCLLSLKKALSVALLTCFTISLPTKAATSSDAATKGTTIQITSDNKNVFGEAYISSQAEAAEFFLIEKYIEFYEKHGKIDFFNRLEFYLTDDQKNEIRALATKYRPVKVTVSNNSSDQITFQKSTYLSHLSPAIADAQSAFSTYPSANSQIEKIKIGTGVTGVLTLACGILAIIVGIGGNRHVKGISKKTKQNNVENWVIGGTVVLTAATLVGGAALANRIISLDRLTTDKSSLHNDFGNLLGCLQKNQDSLTTSVLHNSKLTKNTTGSIQLVPTASFIDLFLIDITKVGQLPDKFNMTYSHQANA